jgi:hypothetical protein
MSRITNTGQLATFSIIKTIIKTNSVLGAKFKDRDFYEFEPKHKSASFNGFPYIIINVPDTDIADDLLGDSIRDREFTIDIVLRMEYLARTNYSSYASNLLTILDSANKLFEAYGYSLVSVNTSGTPEVVVMDQKELIEGTFTLVLRGEVVV